MSQGDSHIISVIYCIFCHRHQQNGSGKTELSLTAAAATVVCDGGGAGKATGIKVNRKTKTRFEGYARNMTGRVVRRSKEAVKRSWGWTEHAFRNVSDFGKCQIFCFKWNHSAKSRPLCFGKSISLDRLYRWLEGLVRLCYGRNVKT